MHKNIAERQRVGALNMCLMLPVCIGLISGCATIDNDEDRHEQADDHMAQAQDDFSKSKDFFSKQRYDEAEKYMTKGLEEVNEAQRLCAASINCVINSEKERSEYTGAYSTRAYIRALEGKYILAIKDARSALSYNKNDANSHYVIGYCSVETGDFNTANREEVILESLDKKLAGDLYARIARAKRRGLK